VPQSYSSCRPRSSPASSLTTCPMPSPSSGGTCLLCCPVPRNPRGHSKGIGMQQRRITKCSARCRDHVVQGEASAAELHQLLTSMTQLFMDICGHGDAAADRTTLAAAAHEAWWPAVDHATCAASYCVSPAVRVCTNRRSSRAAHTASRPSLCFRR
jgi:hypothetical protein